MRRHLWLLILVIAVIAVLPAFAGGDHGKCKYSTQDCLDHMAIKMKSSGWVGVELDTDLAQGYAVTKVFPGSPAEAAGIQAGDVLVAAGLLLPIGFFMGMAFPAGMSAAGARFPGMAPWFWGVNGAASVCASVLATAIALSLGISAAFWAGFGCYVLALAAFARASGQKRAGGRSAGPTPCRGT